MKQQDQSKELATALLQKVLRFVADLPEEDLVALVAGRKKLQLAQGSQKGAKKTGQTSKQRDYVEISVALSALTSREEGEELLADLSLNKAELQKLAAKLDLPVMRDDSVQRLRSKIIETTIGYRLRSRAILGQDRTTAPENVQEQLQGVGNRENPGPSKG